MAFFIFTQVLSLVSLSISLFLTSVQLNQFYCFVFLIQLSKTKIEVAVGICKRQTKPLLKFRIINLSLSGNTITVSRYTEGEVEHYFLFMSV